MVESIYFLKPAWCGTHFAGLWPEQGLQPVTRAIAFRRWIVTLSSGAAMAQMTYDFTYDGSGYQATGTLDVNGSGLAISGSGILTYDKGVATLERRLTNAQSYT
jgi:hypothetical protein